MQTQPLDVASFPIHTHNIPEVKGTIRGSDWTKDHLVTLSLDESFLELPWHLQTVRSSIVCGGRYNGVQSIFVPDNSVVVLRNHRGQVNMGWNEQGVVDPTGRFKHNGEVRGSSWFTPPGWFNAYSFICRVDSTNGATKTWLRNPAIPGYGGASLDGKWTIGNLEGGYMKVWFNDDDHRDNSGQFEQEIEIIPVSAFAKAYGHLT